MKIMKQQKTLSDYIAFLRANGFVKEAVFYETEVVRILRMAGCDDPLEMSTEQVCIKLYEFYDSLELMAETLKKDSNKWDVELHASS
jgi:hypothetical protein